MKQHAMDPVVAIARRDLFFRIPHFCYEKPNYPEFANLAAYVIL
jgi:hypothetical protein